MEERIESLKVTLEINPDDGDQVRSARLLLAYKDMASLLWDVQEFLRGYGRCEAEDERAKFVELFRQEFYAELSQIGFEALYI